MSQSEEVVQRRRQKILSRTTSANSEDQAEVIQPPKGANVFDRYKLLKENEVNSRNLTFWSRFSGLIIFALSFVVPPWQAVSVIVLLLLLRAHMVTRIVQSRNQFEVLMKRYPVLAKLKHVDRIILMGKVLLNALLSFLIATVILNFLWVTYRGQTNQVTVQIPVESVEL